MQFTALLCVFVVAAGLATALPLTEYAKAERYPYADVQSMGYVDDKVPSSEVEEYFKIQTDPSSNGAAVHYPYMPGVYEDARRMEEYNDGPGMQAFPDARMNYYPSIQDDNDEEEEEETEMPSDNEGPGMQPSPNARMNYYPSIQDDKDEKEDMWSEFFDQQQDARMNYYPSIQDDNNEEEEEEEDTEMPGENEGPGMQAFPNARMNYYPSIQDDNDEEEEEETEMPSDNEGPGMQAFPNAGMNYYPSIQDDNDEEKDMMSEFFGEQNARMNYFDSYAQEKEAETYNNEGPGLQAFPDARMNYYPSIQDDNDEEEEEEDTSDNEGPGMQAFPNARMNYYPSIQHNDEDEEEEDTEMPSDNEGPGMQAFPNARMNYYPSIQDDNDEEEEEETEMPSDNEGPGMQAFPNAWMNYFQGEDDPGMQEFDALQGPGDDSNKLMQEFDSYLESIPEEQADKIIDYFGKMQAPSPYMSDPTNNQGESEEDAIEEYIAHAKNVPSRPDPVSRADIEEYFQLDN